MALPKTQLFLMRAKLVFNRILLLLAILFALAMPVGIYLAKTGAI